MDFFMETLGFTFALWWGFVVVWFIYGIAMLYRKLKTG